MLNISAKLFYLSYQLYQSTADQNKANVAGKNNNTPTVQGEFFRFASLLFDQKFQTDLHQVYQNRLKRHLTVFCIDPIVVYLHCTGRLTNNKKSFELKLALTN